MSTVGKAKLVIHQMKNFLLLLPKLVISIVVSYRLPPSLKLTSIEASECFPTSSDLYLPTEISKSCSLWASRSIWVNGTFVVVGRYFNLILIRFYSDVYLLFGAARVPIQFLFGWSFMFAPCLPNTYYETYHLGYLQKRSCKIQMDFAACCGC